MATTDTNRLEGLPLELLEKIIEQLPARDIPRAGEVNRGFYDFIRRSPRIQHKLDLAAAGLEPNWSTGFTLAERVKALEEYRSKWKGINIDMYQATVRPLAMTSKTTVGGVYGVLVEDEIKFCTLPSRSRAIEPNIHKIKISPGVVGFAFDPHADVIVVAAQIGDVLELRLLTMSEGAPHPSALKKTIEISTGPMRREGSLLITHHRLALTLVENVCVQASSLNVWNWRTGELLFGDPSPGYRYFEFLDDYRLASTSWRDGSPELLFLDTEQVPPMGPTQTLFRGPKSSCCWACLFDAGGRKPSPQDILSAPFYPDPSQRILALFPEPWTGFYVTKVETLLKIARERAGEEIRWEEWNSYLIETTWGTHCSTTYHWGYWVSGFRLFSSFVDWQDHHRSRNLRVYDFSPHASMKFLHQADDGRKLMHPSVAAFHLPWDNNDCDTRGINFGHDSMVFEFYPDPSGNVPNAAPDIEKL